MASITSTDALGHSNDASTIEDLPVAPVSATDLLEAVDDRTRRLLGRGARSRRRRIVPPALVLADIAGLSLAYLVATLLWGEDGTLGSTKELLLFIISLPCWVLVAALHGLYRHDHEQADHSTSDDVVGVFHLVTTGVWLLLIGSRVAGQNGPGVWGLATFWLLALCTIPPARTLVRELCKRSEAYVQNTVIVGAGDTGQLIGRKLIRHPEYGANVVGFVDRNPRIRRPDLPEHLAILGGPERLPEIVERLEIERVVIAFSNEPVPELLALVRQLRPLGVQIDLVPWLFELIGPRVSIHSVEGLALLGLPAARHSRVSMALKRTIDIGGAILGMIVLAPLMAALALLVRRDSPGPALFRQTRLGDGMKEFTSFKFRTMKVDTDCEAHREYIRKTIGDTTHTDDSGLYKLERADAVTPLGRWLRRTSLDELPQLINVLRGDMSLVGPRPCIPYEIEHFAQHHFERFLMPQGLTGLWQVTARANSTYGEALDMDVAYVRGWSLGLDLRLLLRTPVQVIRQTSRTA